MPTQTSGDSIAVRHIRMLRLIPREPYKVTAKELTERLEAQSLSVDKRTVERDLHSLSKDFPLVNDSDKGMKPFGWSWSKDAKALSLADMTPSEALALHLGHKYLAGLMPPSVVEQLSPYFRSAEDTLKAAYGTGKSSWRLKVAIVPASQPLLPPGHNEEVERAVYEALLDDRQLDIVYQSLKKTGKRTEARIHPLGLVQRGAVTYVVVRFFDYEEARILALHRIHSARQREEEVEAPAGFTLKKFIDEGRLGFRGTGQSLALNLRVHPDIAEILAETPLSRDQEIVTHEDHAIVSATVQDNAQLQWWILGFGANAEVLAPATLRARLGTLLKEAAQHYTA